MKVREMIINGTKVEFYDDCLVDETERQKILDRVARIVSAVIERETQISQATDKTA